MANCTSGKKTREIVFNKYKGKCAYCGCKLTKDKFTIDHIKPKWRKSNDDWLKKYSIERGENKIENYNPSCFSCNSSKSTFSIEKWRGEIEKKYDRLLRDSSTFRLLVRFKIISKRKSNIKFHFENKIINE